MKTILKRLIDRGLAGNEGQADLVLRKTLAAFKGHVCGDVADLHDFRESSWGFDPDGEESEALA